MSNQQTRKENKMERLRQIEKKQVQKETAKLGKRRRIKGEKDAEGAEKDHRLDPGNCSTNIMFEQIIRSENSSQQQPLQGIEIILEWKPSGKEKE